jgi:hypothetical protein
MVLTDRERHLLQRLAAEGRVTALHSGELAAAMELEKAISCFSCGTEAAAQ